MQFQSLNGYWLLRQDGTENWLPAQVPGGVHTDLMAAGVIPDPFSGANEEKVQWVAEKDWEYRRYFHPAPSVLAQDRVYLTCLGLDTLAEVRLNGKILGVTANMFRTWRWEVKELLKEGENRLDIRFRSPLAHIRQRQRVNPMGDMDMGIRGGSHLRKAPSHFGWDWGPRLPVIGIWQDVRLDAYNSARLQDVRIEQAHENGMVRLNTRIQTEMWGAGDVQRSLRLRVTGPDRQVWQADAPARPQQSIPLIITGPQIWWPNGMGEQPLYRVELDLIEEDRATETSRVLDSRSLQLGLRTVELARSADEGAGGGESFTFVVNGVPVFAKGANWIPADSFPTRVTAAKLEGLVRSAASANQNMLRVWGGGYYESDTFYDLCDRYGILVWQDFQFACATYPLDDPAYVESVRGEVVDNVRRLRHRACLALWCGNNEVEQLWLMMRWAKNNTRLKEAYTQFFYVTLPELLAQEDPGRPYWPGSPVSGQSFDDPNSHQRGDAHLWEVYHQFKPPAYFRRQNPRFASEFGFQSLPAPETIASFAGPKDRRIDSPVMLAHQRAMAGNAKLVGYIGQRFHLPYGLDELSYMSQVYQAEAIRTAVEHWRRHPERTSGALYWQLNDCWPGISWSSIDYSGRWKALHHAARRFYAPVLLSIEESREGGKRKAALWLSNDSCSPWQGHLRWTLETLDGTVLQGGDQPVRCAALSAACVLRQDFSSHRGRIDWRKTVLTAELWQDDRRLATQVVAFVPEKMMRLGRPGLQARIVRLEDGGLGVQVSTRRLARFVELSFGSQEPLEIGSNFSDNYFDLPAGRSVIIPCTLPADWTVEQAQAALRTRSLGDIRPIDPLWISNLRTGWALTRSASEILFRQLILPVLKK
jgi:beta-mannosidase